MIKINLMKGDCLERMKEIPDKSVDMVLTDPPYGTTACKWDSVIPFDKMWAELKRIVKSERSAILLFGSEPFSSLLRVSNLKYFRYDWIWEKDQAGSFLNANRQPLKKHEIISVFSDKQSFYFPQKTPGKPYVMRSGPKTSDTIHDKSVCGFETKNITGDRHPTSVQKFKKERTGHPTAKPVALLEFLVKTYTAESETVLDFTMGSGSTGVACKNLNRNFIGIERDEKYFEIAKERIEKA
jgi:DNA modification methylase